MLDCQDCEISTSIICHLVEKMLPGHTDTYTDIHSSSSSLIFQQELKWNAVPWTLTCFGDRSFSVAGPRLWREHPTG